jgi:hypothetical protein
MESIIQNIQIFIKLEKKDFKQFENLKIILTEHLISKNKKMKDMTIHEFIHYIDDIRGYIYKNNFQNSKYKELSKDIEHFLYKRGVLTF